MIKVDRLDDGWDATPGSQSLIIGELKAARSINQQLHRFGQPAPVITFLRSDIYETVKFNDKNKMATSIERLEWPHPRLMDVLARRVATSLNVKPEDAWKSVFSEAEMRQRSRPKVLPASHNGSTSGCHCVRDSLSGCGARKRACDFETATSTRQKIILAARTGRTRDELHKRLPELETLLDTLRGLGRMSFTMAEWTEAARRSADVSDGAAKEQLGVLYDASVIGVARIGGSKGGSQHVFNYGATQTKPDFSGRIYVHPGLKKGLQLKEGQAGDQGRDGDERVRMNTIRQGSVWRWWAPSRRSSSYRCPACSAGRQLRATGAPRKLPPVVAHVLLHEADEIGNRHSAEHRRPDRLSARGKLAARGFVSRVSRL